MLERLKNIIKKEEITNSLDFEEEIKFVLKIDDLIIGYLTIEENKWVFKYSEEFKAQEKYARLTGFSDLSKIYTADELWPFFKIRIPGLKQPRIQDIIKKEQLDIGNEAQLLERFGERSMSNPYILESE